MEIHQYGWKFLSMEGWPLQSNPLEGLSVYTVSMVWNPSRRELPVSAIKD